jgi:hypothetical protein
MDPETANRDFVFFKVGSSAEEFCQKAETRYLTQALEEAYNLEYDQEP